MSTPLFSQMRNEALHFWPTGFPVPLKYRPSELVTLRCERALASDSIDHIEPRGTAADNTHWAPFVARCEAYFGFRDIKYLDLGCAGGGLVFDFAVRRHFAMGLEGSDYSLARGRAEWATIPDNLRTCDIGFKFAIEDRSGQPFQFDVIGIWDVIEHIPQNRMPVLFDNIRRHLAPSGLFCGTVATRPASPSVSGINHHATVQERTWWEQLFREQGFAWPSQPIFEFAEYPRGNGIVKPANFREQPETGFHFELFLA